MKVAVIGGGIAGVAAATVLVERGVDVTLIEREEWLGGRAGSWRETLATGDTVDMERGFHAFFRQYYNLRSLLRRIDPELSLLEPAADYPILGADGAFESFAGLPSRAPFNVLELTRRTPSLTWRDLSRVNARAALEMLAFDPERTYQRWGDRSARDYLDSLRFPPRARQMLFSVFAHSFFNPEDDMCAAELLMMFHAYFVGNREGLIFDLCRRPFRSGIWEPFADYLRGRGARLRLGESAIRVGRGSAARWQVDTGAGSIEAEAVVLALAVPALRELVEASPELDDPSFRDAVASLSVTRPFAVHRLWLDRPTAPGRAPFAGTAGVGALDNISLYHLFEDESRAWAERRGGSVVELHAYAVDPARAPDALRRELVAGLHALYPETRAATVLDERWLWRQDCPRFGPGSHRRRPGVATALPGVALAGDFVRLPVPSALMERAATSGMMAANQLLEPLGAAPEPLRSLPARGLLARPRWRTAEVRA